MPDKRTRPEGLTEPPLAEPARHVLHPGVVAMVKPRLEAALVVGGRREQFLAFLDGAGERLLDQDVFPVLQGRQPEGEVQLIDGGYDNKIEVFACD